MNYVNCNLSCFCLTLIPIYVGYNIMGYKSEPLPSYRYLRNFSYIINLKTTISSGSRYLPSRVLFPPLHKLAHSRHPLFPCEQIIYGPEVHLRHCGVLTPLHIIIDLPYPSGLQYFSHWGEIPLPNHRKMRRNPCGTSSYPMMKSSSTLSISPVTTQLSLLYSNTNCINALYSTPLACNVAPVFYTTFPTIAHRLCDF